MTNLDFITDTTLRKTIEDSIEYTYLLNEEAKEKTKSSLYKEETYRVIILYTIAIVEAILFYLYKRSGQKIEYSEYKFVTQLPTEYRHTGKQESKVVIAVQTKIEKDEHQIGMKDLIDFFKEKNFMKADTASKLLKINELRNTFHLTKPRDGVKCDVNQVESALKMLLYVIENAPKSLPKVV